MKIKLVSLGAAGLLLLALVGPALASVASTFTWLGNGFPNASCNGNSTTMLWIWTGDDPLSLTINGEDQSGSWAQEGNGSWHFTTDLDGTNYPPTSASITYVGNAGVLTLSGCDEGGSPTPSESASPSDSSAPTPSESASPTDSATPTPTDSATPTPSDSATPIPTETAPPTGSAEPSSGTPTPTGSAEASSGTPGVTPPATSTDGTSNGSGNGALLLVLGLMGLGTTGILILVPNPVNRRRR